MIGQSAVENVLPDRVAKCWIKVAHCLCFPGLGPLFGCPENMYAVEIPPFPSAIRRETLALFECLSGQLEESAVAKGLGLRICWACRGRCYILYWKGLQPSKKKAIDQG